MHALPKLFVYMNTVCLYICGCECMGQFTDVGFMLTNYQLLDETHI